MKNEYNKIDNKIVVTHEMKERILNNISNTDFSNVQPLKRKVIHFPKALSIAACFIILIGVALMLPRVMDSSKQVTEPPVQAIPDIDEYSTLDELASNTSFTLAYPRYFPEEIVETSYMYLWHATAEIDYTSQNNTIVYRMAEGKDDVSGDYIVYDTIKELEIDIGTVSIKGSSDGFYLAVWTDSNNSYSISSSNPLPEDEIIEIVNSVK